METNNNGNNNGFEEVTGQVSDFNGNDPGAMGWDAEIEKENEFILLPEGDYDFQVMDFERGRHQGSPKLPPCNKAVIHMKIFGPNGQEPVLKYNLFLHTKTEGMLSAFFLGIGLKKHGEKLKMNWDAVVGQKGRCKLSIRTYEGNQFNDIKKIYEPKTNAAATTDAPQKSFETGGF